MSDRDLTELRSRLPVGQLDRRARLRLGAGAAAGVAAGRFGTTAGLAQGGAAALEVQNDVEIEYWQYEFAAKVDLVNELIPEFQTANPKITVNHVNFPYDDFQQQVA